MAIQYVDKAGLTAFWANVKAKIATAEQAAVAEAVLKDNVLLGYINTLQGYFVDGKAGEAIKAQSDADGNVISSTYLKIANVNTEIKKGQANGVAELDANGKVPSSQLPSYVDDVVEGYFMPNGYTDGTDDFWTDKSSNQSSVRKLYPNDLSSKIYVDKDTNKTYRWSGSTFVEISSSLALGETSSTAFPGDRGKALEDWKNNTVPSTYLTIADAAATYLTEIPRATTEALGGVILGTEVDIKDEMAEYVPTCEAVYLYVASLFGASTDIVADADDKLATCNAVNTYVLNTAPTVALTTAEINAICV